MKKVIMKKLTLLLTLICAGEMHGMDPTSLCELRRTGSENIQTTINHPLTNLPKELLIDILSPSYKEQHFHSSKILSKRLIKSHIKKILPLRTICKNFNTLLTSETIGAIYKNYNDEAKYEILHKLLFSIDTINYHTKRLPTLILICTNVSAPIFLNFFLDGLYPSELLEHYLKHNIHAITHVKQKCYLDNFCALHILCCSHNINNIDGFLKKSITLLNAVPNIINTLSKDKETPLDIAQESLEKEIYRKKMIITLQEPIDQESTVRKNAFEQLIALLRKHGGKTGKEIREAPMILLLHPDDQLGELSMLPRHIRKYIVEHINALHKQIR